MFKKIRKYFPEKKEERCNAAVPAPVKAMHAPDPMKAMRKKPFDALAPWELLTGCYAPFHTDAHKSDTRRPT